MTPLAGTPVLTAAQMRSAENVAIAAGATVDSLMERAGQEIAAAVRRLAGANPILVLCGPGNNGGDGYVAARLLQDAGLAVRVAASGDPSTPAAKAARAGWSGPVERLEDAEPAPILIDALFGTGLTRQLADTIGGPLQNLVQQAHLSIAVDVPTGLATDSGEMLIGMISPVDITLALGAVKPVHVLAYSAELCGTTRVLDIGAHPVGRPATRVIARPGLGEPGSGATKYNRGMVAVIGGALPGASMLAAEAALRAGAGYVLLLGDAPPFVVPHALVQRPWANDALDDERIGAVVIGPGLGRDDAARAKLEVALASHLPLVIDGDALHLLGGRTFHDRAAATILTPHGGEFAAMFEWLDGTNKIDAARAAAATSGAVVAFKGWDTVIADPAGDVVVAAGGSPWLSTAGTGDVLAGIAGAMATGMRDRWFSIPPGAVSLLTRSRIEAAVWLHAEAARRAGGAFIADDLLREISAVRAGL